MRRSDITSLSVAVAAALALTGSLSFASTPAGKSDGAANTPAASASSLMNELADNAAMIDTWRDYALGTLKSNFSWASDSADVVEAPSIFNRGRANLSRAPAMRFFPGTSVPQDSSLHVALQSTHVADTPLYASAEASSLLPDYSPGLRRLIVAPSFTHRVNDSSSFSVAAILAYQRMAGFDLSGMGPGLAGSVLTPTQFRDSPTAFGAAARFDFNNDLNDWASWQAGYQSRVNMDGFNAYQGLVVRPGSFDVPASANLGLGLKITSNLRADIGVERVMYSDVAPLISNSLPPRLLAQLGGGRLSSSFEWQNLIVRSLAMSWHAAAFGDIGVRYTTRQQPLPTLPLVQQALLPDISSHSWEASFAHGFGPNSTLRLLGVYAPIQLFGAPPTSYNLAGTGGDQVRVEALWTTTF